MLDGVPEPIYLADATGHVVDANFAAHARLGCSREDLLGASVYDFVVELTPEVYGLVFDLIGELGPVSRRVFHRRRDGSHYAAEVRMHRILSGDTPYLVASEWALRGHTRHELYAGVVDGIPALPAEAVVAVDSRGRIARFGENAQNFFAMPAGLAIGEPFQHFCDPSLANACMDYIRRAERSQSPLLQRSVVGAARRGAGEFFAAEARFRLLEASGEPLIAVLLRKLEVGAHAAAPPETQPWAPESPCLNALIGRSEAMVQLRARVRAVATSNATVLVRGETGVGKELVAQALHALSGRTGPLVKVNSAALPDGVIDSELFGHERGAFTGAVGRRVGRIEHAHRGTLFLDEIGDLPLPLQAKLLRVLQERQVEPIGSSRTVHVDTRVVSATHRDLEQAVAEGNFRSDLYYRLNVVPIDVPPLRERRQDIPNLVLHFARLFAARHGRMLGDISEALLARLVAHDWPGNVRELQNLVERAVLLSPEGTLSVDGFDPNLPSARDADEFERKRIIDALERTGWRVSGERGCAKFLALKPSTLESRMKRLGIRRP